MIPFLYFVPYVTFRLSGTISEPLQLGMWTWY